MLVCAKKGKVIQPVLIKAIPQSAKATAMWMTPRAETAHSPLSLSAQNLSSKRIVPTTVKPLTTDPPKSRQPPYSGWLTCPRLILP